MIKAVQWMDILPSIFLGINQKNLATVTENLSRVSYRSVGSHDSLKYLTPVNIARSPQL